MNLSIIPTPQTPQFQARNAKIKYRELRSIPNVPCACCGKKVIIPEQLTKIFSMIVKPLSSIIKSGRMNGWENKKTIWEVLQQFAQANPGQSLDKIIFDDNNSQKLYKAVSECMNGNIVLKVQSILNSSRSQMRSSSVVMKKLAPLKSYLDETPLDVFEQLEIYSQKYPRKTLTEIINMDEIVQFHRMKDLLQRAETKEQIDFHFSNIQKIINKATPQSQEVFDKLKKEALEIFASDFDPQMRIIKIKELYQNFLKQNNCEKLINKINKEIDQIPLTYTTKDSFFVFAHNHNFDDNKIITSIFNPLISTFEHVVPKSENGANKMKNGLVMHQTCNLHRGTMPYEEFFQYHPEMKKNIQKQVNYIARRIREGKLIGEFRFWPMSIANTLYKYTHGIISLDLTSHCTKELEKTKQRIKNRHDSISKLQRQIKALEAESKKLQEENQCEQTLKRSYQSHIKTHKKSKQE